MANLRRSTEEKIDMIIKCKKQMERCSPLKIHDMRTNEGRKYIMLLESLEIEKKRQEMAKRLKMAGGNLRLLSLDESFELKNSFDELVRK